MGARPPAIDPGCRSTLGRVRPPRNRVSSRSRTSSSPKGGKATSSWRGRSGAGREGVPRLQQADRRGGGRSNSPAERRRPDELHGRRAAARPWSRSEGRTLPRVGSPSRDLVSLAKAGELVLANRKPARSGGDLLAESGPSRECSRCRSGAGAWSGRGVRKKSGRRMEAKRVHRSALRVGGGHLMTGRGSRLSQRPVSQRPVSQPSDSAPTVSGCAAFSRYLRAVSRIRAVCVKMSFTSSIATFSSFHSGPISPSFF